MRFLNDLLIGEMITVTEQWIGPLQPVFVSIPEIAPLLPRVKEDHEALVKARTGSSSEGVLRSLSEQADLLDTRHDHLQRGLLLALRSAREIALGQDPPDVALAQTIDDAQEKLFPEGLEIIKASYEAEAGNAAQMVEIAKIDLAEVLGKVPVVKVNTAKGLVDDIGKVGAALGAVEQKKSVAAAQLAAEEITPAETRRRMRAWADTIELVVKALERTKASPSVALQIQKPVVDAAEKARQRRLARRKDEPKQAPPAGG